MEESRFAQFSGLIASAGKSIQRLKAGKMKAYDLSGAHTACLCRLADAGPAGLTQGELARREGMDRSQISRVLAELRERGYVSAAGPEGRYKKRYALTPEGQGITAEIQAAILEINRFVSDGILPEDLAVFYRTLRTITENLVAAVERYLTE